MPVFQRSVTRNDDRTLFISLADDLIENIQQMVWKRLESPIIKDEKIRLDIPFQFLFKAVVGFTGKNVFQHFHRPCKEHRIPLAARFVCDGLRKKRLPDAGWSDEKNILVPLNEHAGVKLHDSAAVYLGVEVEIELGDSLVSSKIRPLQSILPAFLFPPVNFILGEDEQEVGIAHLCLYRLIDSHIKVLRERRESECFQVRLNLSVALHLIPPE